jgi:hypothetical protein
MEEPPAPRREANANRNNPAPVLEPPHAIGDWSFLFAPRPKRPVGIPEPPRPESEFCLTWWTTQEKTRLHALMADADFREAPTRREQIRVAVRPLRPFVDGGRCTLRQISIFFGGLNPATISQQNELSLQSARLSGRPSHLSDAIIK